MKEEINGRPILGLIEEIIIFSKKGNKPAIARIDTGASKSSIDVKLAASLHLGPVIKSRMIKSTHGNKLRPVVEVELLLDGKKTISEFTLADRTHMKYPVLIGRNTLKHGEFLIDPSK